MSQQMKNPDVFFKTLPNTSTHVNLSYEHKFFYWALYGIPKPTTKIPSKVLLISAVSDITLTSDGGGGKFTYILTQGTKGLYVMLWNYCNN